MTNKNAGNKTGSDLASMRSIYTKECVVCGKEFEGIKQKITCSDKCRKKKSRE